MLLPPKSYALSGLSTPTGHVPWGQNPGLRAPSLQDSCGGDPFLSWPFAKKISSEPYRAKVNANGARMEPWDGHGGWGHSRLSVFVLTVDATSDTSFEICFLSSTVSTVPSVRAISAFPFSSGPGVTDETSILR